MRRIIAEGGIFVMDTSVSLKKAGLFLLLTFTACWLLAGVFHFAGGKLQSTAGFIMALAYMFLPMTMAILVQKVIWREPLRRPLRISFRVNTWFAVAWLVPAVLALAAFGAALWFPGVSYSPGMETMLDRLQQNLNPEQIAKIRAQIAALPVNPVWLALGQGLLAGATVNAVAGFGEELGWRGLLLRELKFLGFWRAALVIGLIWGVWHAPLILQGHNYPRHPLMGVFLMTDFCLLYSPLLVYVTLKSRSVLAAAIMHGTINATFGLSILNLKGGSELTVGILGQAGLIVLLGANLLLFGYERFLAKTPVNQILLED